MVQPGLSVLINDRLDLLAGKRAGLVSHAASVLPDLTGIVDALLGAGVNLSALFAAEHGFAGIVGDGMPVADQVDRRTGLPVHSLYGGALEPQPAALEDVDVLIYDFQDVGVRFYTFISTLYYVLRAAGKAGKPVIVLDRPNPVTGTRIEGPLLQPGFESFIGVVPIPVRHGMTIGELALLMNGEYGLGAPLAVVPMQGWERGMWFDQTGLPWVLPSPGMPHLSTAVVYPGTCFFEGTNLSEGRGTGLPFEIAGAPWLDGYELARRLNRLELPGVRFRPHTFHPAWSKHAGQVCEGVQVHVVERGAFQALRAGLHLVAACREQAPGAFEFLADSVEGRLPHFDLLAGSARAREHLQRSAAVDELVRSWAGDEETFAHLREPYLLYR